MKIEIHSPEQPHSGYLVYEQGSERPLRNPKCIFSPYEFDESDIMRLLGEKDYEKFENDQYIFNLPAWKLNVLKGRQTNGTKEQLQFFAYFNNL